MISADFILTSEPTTLFDSDAPDKKIHTMVLSNETESDTQYAVTWEGQTSYTGIVKAFQTASIFERVWYSHEAGVVLTAEGDGLTLHMVYEDV